MSIIKSTALTTALLLGALLCADAWAAPAEKPALKPEDYAKLPICTLSADGKRLAVEPCRTAPPREPMPRRPVPQIIQPTPRMGVAPQVAMPAMRPSQPLETLTHPPGAPTPVIGGYDPGGTRLNNGAPGTVITPSGKTCTKSGGWVQC
jgi:hypothetical protein